MKLGQVDAEVASGVWERAVGHAEEVVVAARQTGDPLLQAECLQSLGNALFHLERHEDALPVFRRALHLAEGQGDPVLEAMLLKDLGITEKLLGEYDQAMLHLELATERNPQWRNGEMAASVLGNLGSLYRKLGAHRLALATYEETLAQTRDLGDIGGEIDCHARLSDLYLHAGHPERALDHAERALALEVDSILLCGASCRGWLLRLATEACQKMGSRDAALAWSNQELAMWRKAGARAEVSQVLAIQGWLRIDDDLGLAEALFKEALETAGSSGPGDTVGALAGLGEVALRQGELEAAVTRLEAAVAQVERRRGSLVSAHQRVVVADLNLTVYQRLIEALLEQYWSTGDIAHAWRAFQVLEQARGRVLAETLAENRLRPGQWMEPELAMRVSSLQRRLRALMQRLTEPGLTELRRSELLDELEKTELEADAVVSSIRRSHPHYGSLRYPEPVTVAATQGLLDQRTALVSYLVTQNRAFVFVVTAEQMAVEVLPTSSAMLAARVANAHDLLHSAPEDGWQAVGARLTQELIEPVRHHLGPETEALIVVPDGPLHALPFELLPSPDERADGHDGHRFLLHDYEISYTPSATVLAELQRLNSGRKVDPPADALVIASPQLGIKNPEGEGAMPLAERVWRLYEEEGFELGPLTFGWAEAEIVADHAGPRSSIHVGGEATETRIKGEPLERYDVLHFATHGLVTAATPARSALVLAPGAPGEDGFLQAREIAKLRLDAPLVVLSACRTAHGRQTPSEGLQSLARAFIVAGASTVVCTLWEVDDAQAAQLMAAFYRHLGRGLPKAAALREAKLECLQTGGRDEPIATWASFVLVGEASGVVPLEIGPGGAFGWAWLIVLGLFVAVAAAVAAVFRARRNQRSRPAPAC